MATDLDIDLVEMRRLLTRIAAALEQIVKQGEERNDLLRESNDQARHYELAVREGQNGMVSGLAAHDGQLSRLMAELRSHADAGRELTGVLCRMFPVEALELAMETKEQ